MKVLVIPDVHLKPWIFDQAFEIMENTDCELAVCLGDLVDDWRHGSDTGLYEETLDKAIAFARRYPDSLWCYGNHDLAYLWDQYDHPGYSEEAAGTVVSMFDRLQDTLNAPENMAIIHRVDNVLFSHAGLIKEFVDEWCGYIGDDLDAIIETINDFGEGQLREGISPVWARPQVTEMDLNLYPEGMLQVVGHTPVPSIQFNKNLLSTDTFSTYSDGSRYGNEDLCWVDTVTGEWGIL